MTTLDEAFPAAGSRSSAVGVSAVMPSAAIPSVDLRVDGRPVAESVRRSLVSLRIASRLSLPTQCELAFATWQGSAAEYDSIPIGARIEVSVPGRVTTPTTAGFDGEVSAVELVHGPDGEALLRIRAYDVLHRLRRQQQLRVFEDVTVADLASTLTSDLGIQVNADEPGPRSDRIVQHSQSDFELLAATANHAGLHLVLVDGELRLVTLAGNGDPVPLDLGTSLLEARIAVNASRARHRIRALGWHAQRAEVMDERATTARGGARVGLDVASLTAGVAEEWADTDLTGRGVDELTGFAQARLDASAGQVVTLHGVAEGDTSLRAGTRVDLRGVATAFQGTYVLTEAIHTLDGTGFRTAFSTEPPTPAHAPTDSTITLGRVTNVDDPEGLGRVRVNLPAQGDLDAGWLAVLCPGAGRDKGIVALPDVDDTVLVALPHGISADGIVIGSIFGQIAPPDNGIVDGAVRRWSFSTPSGHSILLDDDQRRIRIADGSGSFVELGPDLVRLHAQTDLVVEAPGRKLTIRAATVDFAHAPEPEDQEVRS
ncbi:phage baseplate assembly protein V [Actinopolymorpha alba]|uniref:phage baseplate assembly protein V n=1 Tax=Actinopolymorpha alba TaxID=533267 RepID=UPI000374055E|nr:phage baseplate assembly protein V [Actinopolymorpha alba]